MVVMDNINVFTDVDMLLKAISQPSGKGKTFMFIDRRTMDLDLAASYGVFSHMSEIRYTQYVDSMFKKVVQTCRGRNQVCMKGMVIGDYKLLRKKGMVHRKI